ncbi:AfsR/SARP family transcriptional regulator [Streptomyces sp. H27-C3]|uniref:AfsR/SARP family transcriptional regulator n=1 Tax=Streptomyces sp. H27-C3 TaxID=3046305 RepID=UPI0024BB2975|nr:AfsR/SARP family transcriptional regulator [Streptomyces sp. H27-C3]MDJ0460412.1 AfsR/SARP family transcriptional regulator [Streptomyces sp. H27-C3]
MLGPLVVMVRGMSVVPSAAKPRQLLALLAANSGRERGMAAIADELWEDGPPGGPAAVVQTYVKQLRRNSAAALDPAEGSAAKEILSRGYTGYRLNMPGPVVDADEFEALSRRGRKALAAGDSVEASRLLSAALSGWRGPAFGDVHVGPALRAEALRLEEVRLAALEARITADLNLGRHAALVSELAALAGLLPLQENLHAQLMLALHRCGRSPHALEVSSAARVLRPGIGHRALAPGNRSCPCPRDPQDGEVGADRARGLPHPLVRPDLVAADKVTRRPEGSGH